MVQTNEIAYKEDIIKEMSEEMGISERELKEIVDLNIDYINKKSEEEGCYIINIPNLCKIRLNQRIAMSSAKTYGNSKRKEIAKNNVEQLRRIRKDSGSRIHPYNYQPPLFLRLWKKLKMTKYPPNIYVKMDEMIREVEEKTNEIIKEIT